MLRRLLLVLVTSGALLLSAGVGLLAADWPFLSRVCGWSARSLTIAMDGGGGPFFAPAAERERTLAGSALEAAASWAEAQDSVALLVLHRGKLQLERYWHGVTRESLYPVGSLSRSLLGIAYERALEGGIVDSLDEPVEQWLTEWRDEPRGRITIRQLLWNVSGLEELDLSTWVGLLGKGGRLRYGTEFERTALSFKPAHEPGTHFALSNVDAQLLGVILERASGEPYERYIERTIWRPIGAGRATFRLDRRNGMPAVFDGLSASPGDLLRLGALLASDGGAVVDMTRGSVPNPQYGLQVWGAGGEGLLMSGDHGEVWVFPTAQLVIVRFGRVALGPAAEALPTLLRH